MPRRRTPTAIQVLNCALERVALTKSDEELTLRTRAVVCDHTHREDDPMTGSGVKPKKTRVVATSSSIKIPKEKKAELINTRILLTR